MDNQAIEVFCITGKTCDCKSKLVYTKANVEYALRNQTFGDEFKSHLFILFDFDYLSSNIKQLFYV
jgi:UTP-glucose-1-phosphate uridylyltransferase